MADVYEAEDTRTGEVVALKVLGEHVNATSEAVARFVREGRALQNLRHANIVRVIDQGVSDDGTAWLALERLQGVSLDALIRDEGQLRPTRALRFVHDIAKALSSVHARGMIHRDIKPENIFIVFPDTPHEHAKLIDFGIARMTSAELGENSIVYTRMNTMIGTAAFAAPEQMLAATDVSPASDVFCLGVTAYEMLTGALPFAGDNLKDQLKAKLAGRVLPIAPRMRSPSELDSGFAAILASCLAVDPESRPTDGLALLRQLAPCVERATGRAPSMMPPPPTPRAATVSRSSVWGLLFVAIALLTGAAGYVLWRRASAH